MSLLKTLVKSWMADSGYDYLGHALHGFCGAVVAVLVALCAQLLGCSLLWAGLVTAVILLALSIGHELFDRDILDDFWNGACDITAFWLLAPAIYAVASGSWYLWILWLSVILVYLICNVFRGAQMP